jgi:hypothetical protein
MILFCFKPDVIGTDNGTDNGNIIIAEIDFPVNMPFQDFNKGDLNYWSHSMWALVSMQFRWGHSTSWESK